MKKIIFPLLIFCLTGLTVSAQSLYSFGAAGGFSYSKQAWYPDEYVTHEKYLVGMNGAVLAEFFQNDVYKWRAEAMYNELGTKEVVNTYQFSNRINYISFNNYLEIRHRLNRFIPYFLIGPRVLCLCGYNPQVFDNVIRGFNPLHISAAAGVGAAWSNYTNYKPFVEFFYNHDITSSYYNSFPPATTIFHYDFELRLGIKYIFKEKSPECPGVINPAGT